MASGEGRFHRFLSSGLALWLVARRMTNTETPPPPPAQPQEPVHLNQTPTETPELPAERRRPAPSSGIRGSYQLVWKAVSRFMDDDDTTMAAALAYYTTFSIAPLLLIIISIAGLVFGREAVQSQIQSQIQGLIGQGAASQIGAMVQNASQNSSTGVIGAILGVLALIVGATGAFSQLQSSLNQVWHVKPDPRIGGIKNFVGHRILSLGMVLAIAFLLVVSLAVSAALAAFGGFVSAFLSNGLSHTILEIVNFVVSLAIIAALFAAMFKVLPDVNIRWRDVWIGAGMTAVLFTIGKFLIGMYLGHSGTASAYGSAGSFVLIVLWIYYSSLIFLFGAELTAVWSEAYSGAVRPKPGAVKVATEEKLEPQRAA